MNHKIGQPRIKLCRLICFVGSLILLSHDLQAQNNVDKPSLGSLAGYSRIILPVGPRSSFRVQEGISGKSELRLEVDGPQNGKWGPVELKDERVAGIAIIEETSTTKRVSIRLNKPELETFAYYQPAPSAVVIDVWAGESKPEPRKPASISSTKKQELTKKAVVEVNKGYAPLNREQNLFFDLPAVTPRYVYQGINFDTVRERDPGAGWEWTNPDLSVPGGINLSLAAKLFERKQYALAIRSVEFARRDFQASPYFDELTYLEALALRNLGKLEKDNSLISRGDEKLRELMLKTREGNYLPFSGKIRMFFASSAYREERWLDAISQFELITTLKGSEKEADYSGIVMASAESYLALRQYRRAERIYRSVISEMPKSELAKESLYRWGNILSHERAFRKADEIFRQALREYPEHEKIRNEAYFNLAEANFSLGKLSEAQKFFQEYIRRHASNPLAGLAKVRLGEIAELQDRDAKSAAEYYRDAINRFPFSLGETVGRIRLAGADIDKVRDPGFEISMLEKYSDDASLPLAVRQMAEEVLLRYLNHHARFEESMARAERAMGLAEGRPTEIFRALLIKAAIGRSEQLAQAKEFDKLLQLYREKRELYDLAGPEPLRDIAAAYEHLGLPKTANDFMAKYFAAMSKAPRQPASFTTDRERTVLKIARVDFIQGRYQSVLDLLEESKGTEADRLRVNSMMKLQKWDAAKRLADTFLAENSMRRGNTVKLSDEEKVDFLEAQLAWLEQRKEYRAMEDLLVKAVSEMSTPYERFYFLLADVRWYQQKHATAVTAYQKALELFAKSSRKDRAEFRLGMSFIAQGDRKQAVKILTSLAESSQNIWGRSAKQELELIDWESKYSLVLGELPPAGLGIRE